MLPKYSILIGIVTSVLLFVLATLHYPGGSQADINSIGFDWKNNYISNLFTEKAVNGLENGARLWAIAGMFFLSASFATFFIEFSKRIPVTGPSKIIKYVGGICMLFTFLIATPLHDLMIPISSTMFLIGIFYITVFVFKSKLILFKFLCTLYLIVFYYTLYLYGTRQVSILPIMQKLTFASTIVMVLGLNYLTSAGDFQYLKKTDSD